MERFLSRKVEIRTTVGGLSGCGALYRGYLTAYDDEFICINEKTFIYRKYILSIEILK